MGMSVRLDTELVQQAMRSSGETNPQAVVTRALEEFIARRQRLGLLELMGKLEWESDFDYRRERSRK